jgi:hypothetical protein
VDVKRQDIGQENSLDEAIPAAAAIVLLLELHKLEFAKGLKDSLKILLGDVEVNVANIKAVERYRIGMSAVRLRIAGLTVLLGFSYLNDDGNT